IIYTMPQTTHMSIPLDVVERLAEVSSIIGLKDSENDVPRMNEVAKRFAGRDNFSIFMGVSFLSVRAYRAGFDGLVPSSGNLVAKPWQDFETYCAAGDWEQAEILQRRLDDIARVFQRNRTLGQSLAALKAAIAADGTCEPYMLPPLQTLSDAHSEAVCKELAELEVRGSAA